MKSTIALLSSAAMFAALAGCGQTGPLYMPNPPAKPAVAIPAAATAAANPLPAQPVPSNNASVPAPTK